MVSAGVRGSSIIVATEDTERGREVCEGESRQGEEAVGVLGEVVRVIV